MTEISKLNLNDLIGRTLHCHPYLRIDGGLAGNDEFTKVTEKRNNVYTSPRNVRKIFIKSTGIDVVYYRPIVGKGDALSETLSYSEENKKLLKMALEDFINKVQSGNSDILNRVTISGTGFSTFLKDLSVSNLEELYFDWTLLLGNEELLGTFLLKSVNAEPFSIIGLDTETDTYYNEINSVNKITKEMVCAKSISQTKSALVSSFYNYIVKNMCNNSDELSVKFPRLKTIGFISNSNYRLKSDGAISKNDILNYNKNNLFNDTKYESLGDLRKSLSSNGIFKFSLFVSTGVNLYTSNFRVDTATYQFDKDFLYDYFKSDKVAPGMTREAELTKWYTNGISTNLGLESKLWWVKQFREGQLVGQKRAAQGLSNIKSNEEVKESTNEIETAKIDKAEEKLDSTPRTTTEKILNNIFNSSDENGGLAGVEAELELLYVIIGKYEVNKTISEFSPGGKKIYSEIFNRVLKNLE